MLIEIIQKIARRPVPVRVQNYLSTAGFVLFMVFFIVMVNQDIQRFILEIGDRYVWKNRKAQSENTTSFRGGSSCGWGRPLRRSVYA